MFLPLHRGQGSSIKKNPGKFNKETESDLLQKQSISCSVNMETEVVMFPRTGEEVHELESKVTPHIASIRTHLAKETEEKSLRVVKKTLSLLLRLIPRGTYRHYQGMRYMQKGLLLDHEGYVCVLLEILDGPLEGIECTWRLAGPKSFLRPINKAKDILRFTFLDQDHPHYIDL
jgi:hypothetical protein